MAARVTVRNTAGTRTDVIEVPKANGYKADTDSGYLHLTTTPWGGDEIAVFRHWEHVVIEPDRGPNGRFVKRGS